MNIRDKMNILGILGVLDYYNVKDIKILDISIRIPEILGILEILTSMLEIL